MAGRTRKVETSPNDKLKFPYAGVKMRSGRIMIRARHLVEGVAKVIRNRLSRGTDTRSTFSSAEYWEKRYASGEHSGGGSYGKLAEFKAEVVNGFVTDNKIGSVIEFGCGDGSQLSLFNVPHYIGLDVSETAVRMCTERFKEDETKSFFLYDPKHFRDDHSFKADLTLSLDVIYHLVEDEVFERYMEDLFSASNRFVIIYSTDSAVNIGMPPYCRNRKFSRWIRANLPEWRLTERIRNKYPNDSYCDFFVYERIRGTSSSRGVNDNTGKVKK